MLYRPVSSVGRAFAFRAVGCGFEPQPSHTKVVNLVVVDSLSNALQLRDSATTGQPGVSIPVMCLGGCGMVLGCDIVLQ